MLPLHTLTDVERCAVLRQHVEAACHRVADLTNHQCAVTACHILAICVRTYVNRLKLETPCI